MAWAAPRAARRAARLAAADELDRETLAGIPPPYWIPPNGCDPRARDSRFFRNAFAGALAAREQSAWERAGIAPPYYVPAVGLADSAGFKVEVVDMPEFSFFQFLDDAQIPQPVGFQWRGRRRMLLTWRFGADAERACRAINEHPIARANFWTPGGYDPWIHDKRFALAPRPVVAH